MEYWFDFDGVLVNSVAVKEQILIKRIVQDLEIQIPEITMKMLRGYKQQDKIKYILNSNNISHDGNRLNSLMKRYRKDIGLAIESGRFQIDPTVSRILSKKSKIISAAPRAEIDKILLSNGIVFKNVYGQEDTKVNHFKKLLSSHDINNVTYIGDTKMDETAAISVGIKFLGFSKFHDSATSWINNSTKSIGNYEELLEVINGKSVL